MAFEKIKNLPTTFYGKFFELKTIDEVAGYQEIGKGRVSLNDGNPVVIPDDGKITCLFRLIKGQAKTIIVDGVTYTEKAVPAGVNTYAGVRALLGANEFAVPYPTNELIFPLSAAGKTLSKCEHTTDGQINHPNQLNQQAEAIHELYDTIPDFLEAVAANQAEWAVFDPSAVTSGVATALDGVSDHETRISATEKLVAVAVDLTDLETNYPASEYKIGIIPNPSPPRLYLSDGTNWVENVGGGAATFRVSSTVPEENGSLIKSGNIVINFNTNIDVSSITGQITLVDGLGDSVPFTTNVNGNVLTINPDSDLSLVNKAHTLTLGAGISNLAGDMTLGIPVVLHFNTNTAPYATDVSLVTDGTPAIGETVSVDYVYNDDDGDAEEGASTFKIYRGTQADGSDKVEIETAQDHVIVEADIGQYLFGEVTPVASTGEPTGAVALSAGALVPVPAPPSILVAAGNAQNTISFTPDSTLATETYKAKRLADAGAPDAATVYANGTWINGGNPITSPFVDTGLTNNTKYHYVLVMIVNGAESTPSVVVSGTPQPGLSRSSTGLISFKDFQDQLITPWTGSGAVPTIVNESGDYKAQLYRDAASAAGLRYDLPEAQEKPIYISFTRKPNDVSASYDVYFAFNGVWNDQYKAGRTAGKKYMQRVNAGVNTDLVTQVSNTEVVGTTTNVAFKITPLGVFYYEGGSVMFSSPDDAMTGDVYRVGFTGTGSAAGQGVILNNIALCKDAVITCTGLPSGYKLRVGGAGGLVATESGGTASVDISGKHGKINLNSGYANTVEIIDVNGTVVDTFDPATDDPSNPNIWGGDVYIY